MQPAEPSPLTEQEMAALKTCENEIRASLEKYGCDIQGVANISTGNVVVNCVIVKLRPAPAPEAAGVGVAAGVPDAPTVPSA